MAKNPNPVTVKMRIKKTTPGAIHYVELDDADEVIANPTAGKFGGIYVRKTTFGGDPIPDQIHVSVSW